MTDASIQSVPRRKRRSVVFGVGAVIWSAAAIIGSLFFVITSHPYRAVWTLAVGLAVLGLLRALWPGHPWFGSRSRTLDVAAYWAAAMGLMVLSPWVSLSPA